MTKQFYAGQLVRNQCKELLEVIGFEFEFATCRDVTAPHSAPPVFMHVNGLELVTDIETFIYIAESCRRYTGKDRFGGFQSTLVDTAWDLFRDGDHAEAFELLKGI